MNNEGMKELRSAPRNDRWGELFGVKKLVYLTIFCIEKSE